LCCQAAARYKMNE